MKSPKVARQAEPVADADDLDDALCEFDAVIEDFTSPLEKRRFRYDEHLRTAKRRSSSGGASVSDTDTDTDSADWPTRTSFSLSDERLPSPSAMSPKRQLRSSCFTMHSGM
ncbi:regulator of cell cycle RGCC isoform X2 [Phyllopteryx taeniolatus]|uniref:regulator of cell cycle RGCC isoform X2 n=1 Tax=Phyllopteryx taeniolatus TaxID=161469 RepID=UPI002AD3916D|nr:regulator of cell cycle RGCC isoform X2 [Phyllopteryx taeniolatus]